MLELGAGVALGKQIRDLFHFEGSFERDWKVELATEEKHPGHIGIFFCDAFDLIAQFQDRLDLPGQRLQRFDDSASLSRGKGSHPAEEQADEREDDNLRRERFRSCNADLRSGMHVNASVALARNCTRDVVADSKSAKTFAPAFAEGAERVRSLAALADSEEDRKSTRLNSSHATLSRMPSSA